MESTRIRGRRPRRWMTGTALAVLMAAGFVPGCGQAQPPPATSAAQAGLDRSVLPIVSVDGKKFAEGHIPKTQPFVFSADEGTDVGVDGETNVSNDYKPGANAFAGRIIKVTIERK